jgi:hypothetical protein
MVQRLGAHVALTATLGIVSGGIGALGARYLKKCSAPLSGPLTTALIAASVSSLTKGTIDRSHLVDKLKGRFGDHYQYEEIAFMAVTFFGTAFLTHKLGPKIAKRALPLKEVAAYTTVSTTAAILSLLWTDSEI